MTSEGASVLEMWTDRGDLKIAGRTQNWKQGGAVAVPNGSVVELTNTTDRELLIRLYTGEAK